jgi:hypothetical protein
MRSFHVPILSLMISATVSAALPAGAAAQAGQRITDVRVEQEGTVVTDPGVLSLIETTVGEP